MIYTTVQGDKWDGISYKVYGDTRFTDVLIAANPLHRKVYIFSAGINLVIPEVETKISAENLPPWKRAKG